MTATPTSLSLSLTLTIDRSLQLPSLYSHTADAQLSHLVGRFIAYPILYVHPNDLRNQNEHIISGDHMWVFENATTTTSTNPVLIRVYAQPTVPISKCRLISYFPNSFPNGKTVILAPLRSKVPFLPALSVELKFLANQNTHDQTAATLDASRSSLYSSLIDYITRGLKDCVVYKSLQLQINVFDCLYKFEISDVIIRGYKGHNHSSAEAELEGNAYRDSPMQQSFPELYFITENTKVNFRSSESDSLSKQSSPSASYYSSTPLPAALNSVSDNNQLDFSVIGGLDDQLASVRELVELPLLYPDLFSQFGIRPPRGLLLYGPPGTGKTLIARSIATSSFAKFYLINGPEIISKYVGESESKLRSIFLEAKQNAPSIIFVDEIDSIAPSREHTTDMLQQRLVSTLLTLMDGIDSVDQMVVIGATNRPDSLDAAMRRPGRLDREIEIGIPNSTSRLDILLRMLTPIPNQITRDFIDHVAAITHGFVGADLKALCAEASMHALTRFQGRIFPKDDTIISTDAQFKETDLAKSLFLINEDMKFALTKVKASAMREVLIDVPRVKWTDIGGQNEVKAKLHEVVEWPLTHPEVFVRLGITPPKGILLYGPPGCSKTLMAKALANESSRNFIAIKGPELLSQWVGESEKAIREIFRKARAAAPSIIFLDEVDSIASARSSSNDGSGDRVIERVLSQMLIELDGIEPLRQVTVLAATNRPDLIDRAILRPGRIDHILYVSPPDDNSMRAIINIELSRTTHTPNVTADSILDLVKAKQTKSATTLSNFYSGSDVVSICREAAIAAMEEDVKIDAVHLRHYITAIESVEPRITRDMIHFYEEFARNSNLTAVH